VIQPLKFRKPASWIKLNKLLDIVRRLLEYRVPAAWSLLPEFSDQAAGYSESAV
jgi:hypothetical protein